MSIKTILVIVLIVGCLIAAIGYAIYFFSKRMEIQREEQEEMIETYKQKVSVLVIDKKKMRVCDAGFSQNVMDHVPKRMRKRKTYVVKAKMGPQILPLLCQKEVFDVIPVKKEIKATISGMYIVSVEGLRGTLAQPKEAKRSLFGLKLGGK